MNARTFLIVPAALAVAVLAGCGQGLTEVGSAQVRMPSTAVCSAPHDIRDRAPEGVCTVEVVDDEHARLSGW